MTAGLVLTILLIAALGASAVADFLRLEPRTAMLRQLGLKRGTETQLGVISVLLVGGLALGRGHGVLTTVIAAFLVGYFLIALALHRRVKDHPRNSLVCIVLAALSLALAVLS
jgi:hypothetical protein